jgi:phenylalanyl-tRNA synthetase alpha subunit
MLTFDFVGEAGQRSPFDKVLEEVEEPFGKFELEEVEEEEIEVEEGVSLV